MVMVVVVLSKIGFLLARLGRVRLLLAT